ncbi:MAG: carbohydrate ABC transporter permease [Acutalibacteraceae bacterium]
MSDATITKPAKKPLFKKRRSIEVKQRRYGYMFSLPFIIGALIFVIYPMILSILQSFSDVTFDPTHGLVMNFADPIANYKKIWWDELTFRDAVIAALKNMALNVPIVVIFSFFMASVLNTKFIGRGFARSVMFMPVIIASGIVSTLSNNSAASLLDSADRFSSTADGGVQVTTAFETLLEGMDIDPTLINFIMSAVNNISSIVTMSAVSIVIFIAGLQSISPSIYEASYIEGATKWEVFWKISLPMVSPLILLSIVWTIVDSFNSSNSYVIYLIHNNIVGTEYDVAAAMACSYSLIIVVLLLVVFAVLSKIVFYQD